MEETVVEIKPQLDDDVNNTDNDVEKTDDHEIVKMSDTSSAGSDLNPSNEDQTSNIERASEPPGTPTNKANSIDDTVHIETSPPNNTYGEKSSESGETKIPTDLQQSTHQKDNDSKEPELRSPENVTEIESHVKSTEVTSHAMDPTNKKRVETAGMSDPHQNNILDSDEEEAVSKLKSEKFSRTNKHSPSLNPFSDEESDDDNATSKEETDGNVDPPTTLLENIGEIEVNDFLLEIYSNVIPKFFHRRLNSLLSPKVPAGPSLAEVKIRSWNWWFNTHRATLQKRLPASVFEQFYKRENEEGENATKESQLKDSSELTAIQLWYIYSAVGEYYDRFKPSETKALSHLMKQDLQEAFCVLKGWPNGNGNNSAPVVIDASLVKLNIITHFKPLEADLDANGNENPKNISDFLLEHETDLVFMSEVIKLIKDRLSAMPASTASIIQLVDSLKDIRGKVQTSFVSGLNSFMTNSDMINMELRRICMCPGQNCAAVLPKLYSLPCYHYLCMECVKAEVWCAEFKELKCPFCNIYFQLNSRITAENSSEWTDKIEETLKNCLPVNFIATALRYCLKMTKPKVQTGKFSGVNCDQCLVPPDALCLDCSTLCCRNHALGYSHEFGKHALIKLDQILLEPGQIKKLLTAFCPEHHRRPIQWCTQCRVSVCSHSGCKAKHSHPQKIITSGNSTQLVDISTVNMKKQELINILEATVRNKSTTVESTSQQIRRTEEDREMLSESIKQSVDRYFDDFQQLLDQKRAEFFTSLTNISNECKTENETAVHRLSAWNQNAMTLLSAYHNTTYTVDLDWEMNGGGDKPDENAAASNFSAAICELDRAINQLDRIQFDACDGATIWDPRVVSYPESVLRGLHQQISQLSPSFTNIPCPRNNSSWECVVKVPGLLMFVITSRGNAIYVIKRNYLGATPILKYDLNMVGTEDYHPSTFAEGGPQSLTSMAIDTNGSGVLFVTEKPYSSIEIPSMKMSYGARLVLYSLLTKKKLGETKLMQMENPENIVYIKTFKAIENKIKSNPRSGSIASKTSTPARRLSGVSFSRTRSQTTVDVSHGQQLDNPRQVTLTDGVSICDMSLDELSPTNAFNSQIVQKRKLPVPFSGTEMGDFTYVKYAHNPQHAETRVATVVTNVQKHNVWFFDSNFKPIKVVGSEDGHEGATPEQFSYPNGVASDNNGHICIADSGNARLQFFDINSNFLRQFHYPESVRATIDSSNVAKGASFKTSLQFYKEYLYFADPRNDSIWRMKYV